ncbi:MAG: hypothetical protein KJ066_17300 [Acidobacteria bacterium]|nr:hypothetical protein [Acidobacteriota bacterium]
MVVVAVSGVVAFVLSIAFTLVVKRLALQAGIVATPKADRWHRGAIPLLGGGAIFLAVVLTALAMPGHAAGLWVLLAGASALFFVGLADDLRPLKPQTKLIAQILVAAGLAAAGLQLHLTGNAVLDVLLTMFWFVAITNAFNLLDNMDGLAAGIAAITAGFRLGFLLLDGNYEGAAIAAAVTGAALGFLCFNFNPASIFMGDAGSLFLGMMVAGLSLVGGWPYSKGTLSVLLFPVLILLVPIFDTAFVTIARTVAGRSISIGGRDHTSHRLVALGLSEREAVLLLYLVALVSGAVAFFAYRYGLSYTVVLIVFLGIALGLLGVFLGRLKVYAENEATLDEGARFVSLVADFPYKRQIATVCLDVVLIVTAYYTAYLLRFEGDLALERPLFIESLPVVIGSQLFAFALFRVYQGVWRYTSLSDLFRLGQAVSVGSTIAVLLVLFIWRFEGYSRTIFVLDWLLLFSFVAGSRLSFRALGELVRPGTDHTERVLIYGAGDGGLMVAREFANNRALGGRVVAFLDDDRGKHNATILGVPVAGGFDRLAEIIDQRRVARVVISSSRVGPEREQEIRRVCDEREVRVSRAVLSLE